MSRDAFEFDGAPEVVDYAARSSLASAFAPAPNLDLLPNMDLDAITSAFQRRMVDRDLLKQLSTHLSASDFDVLLIDLIDERLRVIRVGETYVTWSPELQGSGVKVDRSTMVEQGSAEYFAEFTRGWETLIKLVDPKKIVVNRVFWAKTDQAGSAVGDPTQTDVHNARLEQLYAIIAKTRGVRFLDYPRTVFVTDRAHKWGPSPYHYVDAVYHETLRGLATLSPPRDSLMQRLRARLSAGK